MVERGHAGIDEFGRGETPRRLLRPHGSSARPSGATRVVFGLCDGAAGGRRGKSMEPIACRACADPEKAHAAHQKLIHFANDSPWSDRDVRREAVRYGIDALTSAE